MRFSNAVLLSLLLAFAAASFAAAGTVSVIEPFNTSVGNGQAIMLGKVGPGQTFYVNISASTTNAAGVLFTNGWNQLVVTHLPPGWVAANSSLYNQELSVKITTASSAPSGPYNFSLTAVNIGNYSKLGNVTFNASINVTPNVFILSVSPTSVSTGPGQPVPVHVTINNTGVSDSPFLITVDGLPGWNITKEVIALHHTTENFTYPIYADEPGAYQAAFNVSSVSSPLVYKRIGVTLNIQASVPGDYEAVGQGSVISSIIYEPVYAIMYLISLLFGGSSSAA